MSHIDIAYQPTCSHPVDPLLNISPRFNAFELDLQRMNIFPLTGLFKRINPWCDDPEHGPCPTPVLDPPRVAILDMDKLTWKEFSLTLNTGWENHEDCPGLLLAKRILNHSSPGLQNLSLQIDSGEEFFLQKVAGNTSFLRLKKLNVFRPLWPSHDSYFNVIESLLLRAPVLQALHIGRDINLVARLLEGRTAAALVWCQKVRAPFDEISNNVISRLRLTSMELLYTGPEFDFGRFNRITPVLLQTCCTTTLTDVWVDALLIVPLMCYGICLTNVKWLQILINYDQLARTEPRLLRILKNLDFTRIFPNLKEDVILEGQVQFEPDHINRIIKEANIVSREPVPDRACNTKQLILRFNIPSHAAVQFFAEMFPNIETLNVSKRDDGEDFPFESIWKHWVNLINFHAQISPPAGQLDGVLCGIFPEEVAELRLKDEEYLKRVNIVPVMPAITCLRHKSKILV